MTAFMSEEVPKVRPHNATLQAVEADRLDANTTRERNNSDGANQSELIGEEDDPNESPEETQRSTVIEPGYEQAEAKKLLSKYQVPPSRSPDEITDRLGPTTGAAEDDKEDHDDDYGEGEIERRLFVGSKLSEELKRLRDNRARRLSSKKQKQRKKNRNRKRRRQISSKSLVKMTQTRQSSSSTQAYADADATGSATDASVITLSPTSQLTTSLRQHLANPLNLSSTVQRLIMSKLANSNNNQQQASGQKFTLAGEHPAATSSTSMIANQLANMQFLQPVEEYRGESHQTKKYSSDQHRQPSEVFVDSFGQSQTSPSTIEGSGATFGPAPMGNNRQVVPIEIIGLDPAVTNSIIYGNGAGGEIQLVDNAHIGGSSATRPADGADQPTGSSNLHQQQQTRGSRNTNSGLRMTMNQPSILHIHHFHPPAGANGKLMVNTVSAGTDMVDQHQSQQAAPSQQDETNGGTAEQTGNDIGTVHQALSESDSQSQWQSSIQPIQNQQLFVNDKGELVYLAIKDKSPADAAPAAGQEYPSGQQATPDEAEHQVQADNGAAIGQNQPDIENQSVDQAKQQPNQYAPASDYQQQQLLVIQQPTNGRPNIVPMPMHSYNNYQNSDSGEGSSSTGMANVNQYQPAPANGSQLNEADRMIMVSYRPTNTRQVPGDGIRHQSMRGAYNDGQESSMVTFANKAQATGSPQNYDNVRTTSSIGSNSTATSNLDIVDQLISQMNNTGSYHQYQNSPLFADASKMQQVRPVQLDPLFMQPGRSVLDSTGFRLQARPLMLDEGATFQPTSNASQDRSQVWNRKPIAAGAGSNLSVPFLGHHHHHQNVDDKSALFSSLALRPSSVAGVDLPLPGNVSAAANLLTNNELLGLLQGLKRPTNNTSHLVQASPSSDVAGKLGRFELTQSSNQPSSYLKSQQNQTETEIRNKVLAAKHKDSIHSSKPTIMDPADMNQPNVAGSGIDLSDNSGISNLAMAFISVISFVTLALFAASLIYRYRRRSMGRCSNLAGRSRLNLTQRTKHFVRSNFVNPNDVSSVKSAGNSTLKTTSIAGTNSTVGSAKSGRGGEPGAAAINIATDRYTATKSYGNGSGLGGKCLSTFHANQSPVANNERYHSNSDRHQGELKEESATDIKTLNTRVQKPSYLKSLISTPAAGGKKKRSASGPPDVMADSHYLNIKQRYAAASDRKKSSHFDVNHHLNYGSSSTTSKMSTIDSLTDVDHLDSHTCGASPGQHRKQTTCGLKVEKGGKLTNLPLSRHVVAPANNCKSPADPTSGHRL